MQPLEVNEVLALLFVEQFWTDEDMAHQTINLLEHLAMLGAGAVALWLGVLGLLEAFARATGEGGTDS